jgi:hypothetical protein
MPNELILAVKATTPEPPLPPVTEAAIAEAEGRLGFALPDLLRELYLHVGNGRFGPGYGLLSLDDVGDGELSLVGSYLELLRHYADAPSWRWPAGRLAFCDWGCNIYSCLDCTRVPNPVSTYGHVEDSVEDSFVPTRDSFESWLRDWLAGLDVFEPVYEHAPELDQVITNPFSKEPTVIKGRRPRRLGSGG